MKFIKPISLITLGACIALIVMLYFSLSRDSENPSFVTVKVVNESDHEIVSVEIEHARGKVTHHTIQRGTTIILPLHSSGENSYTISVKLDNGAELSGGVGYVESGQKTREIISNTGIKSSYVTLY